MLFKEIIDIYSDCEYRTKHINAKCSETDF
jgi:hypothetical protein